MKTVSMSAMLALFASFPAVAENAAMPLGEPVLEAPTLHSLGVYWIVRGDDNRNATIEMECRGKGAKQATRCLPLFRVEKGAHKTPEHGTRLDVPADGWLFAGSALRLEPGRSREPAEPRDEPVVASAVEPPLERTEVRGRVAGSAAQHERTVTLDDPHARRVCVA